MSEFVDAVTPFIYGFLFGFFGSLLWDFGKKVWSEAKKAKEEW